MSADLRYWIGFNLVKGIGPTKVRALLEHFGDLRSAWTAAPDELRAAGLDRRSLESLLAARTGMDLDLALKRVERAGVQVLTWESEGYPRNLLNIAQPPPVLYVRGTLTPADEWAMAMVGTRRASAYGREVARELARQLAASHVTVVSGLARGIDSVSHQAALDAGGRTIAVLGSGLDYIYPPEHKMLAEAIANSGALVSDYALGTPPENVNFPPRNRIISGLAKGVVVVEAPEGSGALITAEFAAEQGRDVFAVPGSILQRSCRGTNKLIQQGAKPVLNATDVLEELNMTLVTEYTQASLAFPADETERQLMSFLSAEPVHVDELRAKTGLPIAQVSSTLALMELKGLVRQVSGMNYVAAREARAEYRVE
ncbi:MAG TPA: DNA-processing protein DprA [Anaerolineales bacterium]|nr:DNA-processing protein DprA [Anaerolineales bacterium]